MLLKLFKKSLNQGFLFKYNIIKYNKININLLKKKLFGFNKFILKLFFLKIEKNYNIYFKSINLFKILNLFILKIFPLTEDFKKLHSLNIIRNYLILNKKGKCYILKKPSKSQRTKSNAKSVKYKKNLHFKVRSLIKKPQNTWL